jgi:thiosulfate/3-mercaptopyruvate sulfurtransferase
MTYRTLIDAAQLLPLLAGPRPPVLLDCSFDLADPAAGERAWAATHLPGSRHVHLERDLSGAKAAEGPRSPRFTGRHPLPERAAFAALAGQLGIAPGTQVVTFDGQGGPYAARAWWLLRWLGHDAVALLDGGVAGWMSAGGTMTHEASPPQSQPPYPAAREPAMSTIDAPALLRTLGRVRVLDARNAERFRGESETLDPVGGHIPGATLRFFKDNLLPDGHFKPAAQLRTEFDALACKPDETVHQCGSGVTACHNLLAMMHAGLEGSALYVGSWSEWCADPARPVALG